MEVGYFQKDETTAHSVITRVVMLPEVFDIWPSSFCDFTPADFFCYPI